MKRSSSFAITLILMLCSLPSVLHAATGRAVSLRILESKLRSGSSSGIADLCGITRVSGYVIDKQNRDIIIVGVPDPDYPALHLEDFVVALRNIEGSYGERKGHTIYYTAPGCSIDPVPAVLQQLRQTSEKLSASPKIEDHRKVLTEWESIGRQPQKVRVLGVPFDTHFAKVMVDADYLMKRLVNGSLDPGIPGFRSLLDMGNSESNVRTDTMDRFWFCPGESTYSEENGLVMLTSCRVKLLTEKELLSSEGTRVSSGGVNPLASQFAESFTQKYDQIAAVQPIYLELEGLFRFAGLAGLMKDQRAFSQAGFQLPYLMEKCPLMKTPVSRMLPGLTRVLETSTKTPVENGELISYRFQMCCGGVKMDVHPRRVPARQAARSDSSRAKVGSSRPGVHHPSPTSTVSMKKTVIAARKSPQSLSWDFPLPN